jgi:hypothetical protein
MARSSTARLRVMSLMPGRSRPGPSCGGELLVAGDRHHVAPRPAGTGALSPWSSTRRGFAPSRSLVDAARRACRSDVRSIEQQLIASPPGDNSLATVQAHRQPAAKGAGYGRGLYPDLDLPRGRVVSARTTAGRSSSTVKATWGLSRNAAGSCRTPTWIRCPPIMIVPHTIPRQCRHSIDDLFGQAGTSGASVIGMLSPRLAALLAASSVGEVTEAHLQALVAQDMRGPRSRLQTGPLRPRSRGHV